MSSEWSNEKFRRPTISFTETLMKGASGAYRERDEYVQFMYKALVIALDPIGGKLETPDGKPVGAYLVQKDGKKKSYTIKNDEGMINMGPRNPKNSVKARIISNTMDALVDDDDLRVYWPLFPGVANPTAGEVVYVVFEDETMNHGLWLSRAPLNGNHDTPNQVLMPEEAEGKAPLMGNFVGSTDGSSAPKATVPPLSKDRFRLTRRFVSVPKG
jgi:hypothetical protein